MHEDGDGKTMTSVRIPVQMMCTHPHQNTTFTPVRSSWQWEKISPTASSERKTKIKNRIFRWGQKYFIPMYSVRLKKWHINVFSSVRIHIFLPVPFVSWQTCKTYPKLSKDEKEEIISVAFSPGEGLVCKFPAASNLSCPLGQWWVWKKCCYLKVFVQIIWCYVLRSICVSIIITIQIIYNWTIKTK